MRIDRPELDIALRSFVRGGHGLVVGRAGVGKTHALNLLGHTLDAETVPHLFLGVDLLGDAAEDDLRLALGYEESSFAEQLQLLFNASAEGVVIFDGFDAARNAAVRARLLQLVRGAVRRAPGGWSVIVSVRNYDAAKSPVLLDLFGSRAVQPHASYRTGITARHFAVPELNDREVASAIAQIPGFADVHTGGSKGLKRLAHIPFNLWLIERVMRAAEDSAAVSALESETQLLGLYWETQVTGTPEAEMRMELLRRGTERMVAERRLTFRKADAYTPDLDAAWRALLSAEVLSDSGPAGQRAGFTHNILFDYAVSVLVIADTPAGLATFLTTDTSRPLFLRPSLVYYFTRLWQEDRRVFWNSFWHLMGAAAVPVRLVGRLIPPFVIVTECREENDLKPLLDRCHEAPVEGAAAVLRVLQGLRFAELHDPAIWVSFAQNVARVVDRAFAWELASVLSRIVEDPAWSRSTELRCGIGEAARALFAWAWRGRKADTTGWSDAFASTLALPLVLSTFDTAPADSARVVRDVLRLLNEPDFPIRYFTAVAEAVTTIAVSDPSLVGHVYRLLFAHAETSEATTDMGGVILRLRSTRRQDFSMCHYTLGKAYPEFLKLAPEVAIPVGVDLLNDLALVEHVLPYLREGATQEDLTERFEFLGQERRYIRDMSTSWRELAREEVTDIAKALEHYLATPDLALGVAHMVNAYANHAATAASWGMLLEAGASQPEGYATILHELALARPIQLGSDTLEQLGTFVERAALYWDSEQRAAFECAAIRLTGDPKTDRAGDADEYDANARIRDRLLACIPRDLLVTDPARARIEALVAADALPSNEPLTRYSVSSRAYSEDEWLADQGVDLALPANAAVRALGGELAAFVDQWRNTEPTLGAITAILPRLRTAPAELTDAALNETVSMVDSTLLESTWAKLAAVAHSVIRTHPARDAEAFVVARGILLQSAQRPEQAASEAERDYTWPHWASTPRTEAIQGLAHLALIAGEPAVVQAFAAFTESRNPSERFLSASYSALLCEYAVESFWGVVDRLITSEANPLVIVALLDALRRSGQLQDPRLATAVQEIAARWADSDTSDLTRSLADWLVYFAVRRNAEWAWSLLRGMLTDLPHYGKMLKQINFIVINLITPRSISRPTEVNVIRRGVGWIREVLDNLRVRAADLCGTGAGVSTEARTELWRLIHGLTDDVVMRAYFNIRRGENPDGEEGDESETNHLESGPLAGQLAARDSVDLHHYYTTIKPVLNDVLAISDVVGALPAQTAHHFMELLNALISVEPDAMLDLAARVVAAGSGAGYHLDSLAVREVVRMVETVLTDHRERIAEGKPLNDMLGLLDVFADAGWPEALRLVWRLDEVFR